MKRVDKRKKSKKSIPIIVSIILIAIIIVLVAVLLLNNNKEIVDQKDNNNEQQKVETDSNKNAEESNNEQTKKDDENTAMKEEVKTDNGYIVGQKLPDKPTYIKGVLIANKKYPLPKDYAPGENPEARAAFDKMAADAKKAGFNITAFSTYRSYDYQTQLYQNYVNREGKDKADRYSARPGYSEHQTGLAFDVGEVERQDLWLEEAFGETEAGKWLMENAHKYGFILRYPKGKEDITGYMYESWHYRYLGVELATKVEESGLTLEEYLGID